MVRRVSRRGLSPLLAIIIGLVVTIVAGILLAQLYFSYAATISARPAANVEYVDLVVSDGTAILTLNIKNMGNVEIHNVAVYDRVDGDSLDCTIAGSTPVPAGGTVGVACTISGVSGPSSTWSGYVEVTFGDQGTQVYAISARARSA